MVSLAQVLISEERGLIVCGPQDDPRLPDAVARLAERLAFPVLADPLSGVRMGRHDRGLVIDAYDALLRGEAFAAGNPPAVVLQIGAPPTSKPLQQYLQRHAASRLIVVDSAAGWREPLSVAAQQVFADPTSLCEDIAEVIDATRDESRWSRRWRCANAIARRAIGETIASFEEPFEGRIFAELAGVLPDGAVLVVGNSMPVRDADAFMPSADRALRIVGNRGANGIDGVLSTALGVAAVTGAPTVLVIGDLSLYHDLSGLLAARLHRIDLTIVLVDNDGGGIFSFLPQADDPEHFELLFGTPHGLDFRGVVEMFGGDYMSIESAPVHHWETFRDAVAGSLAAGGLRVVRVRTDRARNVALHRRVWPAVAAAVADVA